MASRLQVGTRAVILAGALSGCTAGATPSEPTRPAPTLTATAPIAPSRTGTLFGMVTEMTSTGPRPVEGVVIDAMTCARINCPDSISHRVTTAADGTYRIGDLYNGDLNFLWIGKTGEYASAGPRPSVPCDLCDAIVTIDGETRLDLKVLRP